MSLYTTTSDYIKSVSTINVVLPVTIGFWGKYIGSPSNYSHLAFLGTPSVPYPDFYIGSAVAFYDTNDSADPNGQQVNGTFSSDQWYYFLYRQLGLNEAYFTTLDPSTGTILKVSDVSTNTGVGNAALGIGSGTNITRTSTTPTRIAEFFFAFGIDLLPSGGAMDDVITQQMAYRGPFSFPHFIPAIQEYYSFRTGPQGGPFNEVLGDVYFSENPAIGAAPLTWTTTGTVEAGEHPPLAVDYVRPVPQRGLLLI